MLTHFDILPEIKQALDRHQPVVALESTIITHGMPYPQSVETALAVETIIRANGALPATIAIMDGAIKIGLGEEDLLRLAKSEDVLKLSRADLAFALSGKRMGSTTVAATMIAAQLAGIEVFATGGIGGVHQGAAESFDISADLQELAHSNVIVVCAGPKAILDIEKTMEVLETNGVPVIAYRTDELPAFWSRSSGLKAPLRLDDSGEIAAMWAMRRDIRQHGGMLVTNPVPPESEIPAAEMTGYIARSIADAKAAGIAGKAVTPWLLSRILEITGGRSLATNIALMKNNARLAADVAVAIAARNAPVRHRVGFIR